MILARAGEIPLPAHRGPGGFDHAAVHGPRRELYVAHTANDALDIVDCKTSKYLRSVSRLDGVAGALVSEAHDLVFTSNRGENTVGIFAPGHEDALTKVTVGVRPNGLAYDPGRGLLLAANVGDPSIPAVFDAEAGCFYVNIADPAQIAIVESANPKRVARSFPVSAVGPHGLDLDGAGRRLFCACDDGTLVVLDARSGVEMTRAGLGGAPDVIFFNPERRHLYVAIGDPGLIEVFETDGMRRVDVRRTEAGAHTLGFDQAHQTVYAFLPESHRALVLQDRA